MKSLDAAKVLMVLLIAAFTLLNCHPSKAREFPTHNDFGLNERAGGSEADGVISRIGNLQFSKLPRNTPPAPSGLPSGPPDYPPFPFSEEVGVVSESGNPRFPKLPRNAPPTTSGLRSGPPDYVPFPFSGEVVVVPETGNPQFNKLPRNTPSAPSGLPSRGSSPEYPPFPF